MLRQHRLRVICLSVVIVSALCTICGLTSRYAFQVFKGLDDWDHSDPKQMAVKQTKKLVDAIYLYPMKPNPQEDPLRPGEDWPRNCWEFLRQPAIESSNKYTLTATFYNWEDGGSFGASGADVVEVQIDFANGSQVLVELYANRIIHCYHPRKNLKQDDD